MPRATSGDGAALRLPRPSHRSTPRIPSRRRARRRTGARRRRSGRVLGSIQLRSLLSSWLELVRALPDQRWLDRLVRSRWWIPVLGVMLTLIVAMQVEVLKYGAGTGRAINLETRIESRNQLLSASVAALNSPQRIEQAAAQMGMVMAGPTSVQFLHAMAPGAVREAIANIKSPNSQSFLAALAASAPSAAAESAAADSAASGASALGATADAAVAAVTAGAPMFGATQTASGTTASGAQTTEPTADATAAAATPAATTPAATAAADATTPDATTPDATTPDATTPDATTAATTPDATTTTPASVPASTGAAAVTTP